MKKSIIQQKVHLPRKTKMWLEGPKRADFYFVFLSLVKKIKIIDDRK